MSCAMNTNKPEENSSEGDARKLEWKHKVEKSYPRVRRIMGWAEANSLEYHRLLGYTTILIFL